MVSAVASVVVSSTWNWMWALTIVTPGGTVTLHFAVRVRDHEAYSQPDSAWGVIKVACNGMVDYIPVPGTSIAT